MSYKQDFIKAITHQDVFPVPYAVRFTVEAKQKFSEYIGRPFSTPEYTGSYSVYSQTNQGWEEIKPGYFRDYFGVIWNKTLDKTLGIVDDPPLKNATFGNYKFPNPDSLPVYGYIEENNRRYPDHFHFLSIGFALYERAWSLAGMENILTYFLMEPEFMHELLDRITAYNLGLIKNAASIGVDAVRLGDDWAMQTGLILDPETWRTFIKPRFKKISQFIKERGLYVSLHCCGKVDSILDDIVECGVDVFDPFQPDVMDIYEIRERYRNKLAFWGGLSIQSTLPYGSVEEVKKETNRLLTELGPGGGYVFAPSHSMTRDIPPENIIAFLEILQNQVK